MSERGIITADEAIARLVDDDTVHCFLNPNGILLGADWSREKVIECIRAAEEVCETGEQAQAMKHGIAAIRKGRTYFFETRAPDAGRTT